MAHWFRIFSVLTLAMILALEASAGDGLQIIREMLSKNAAWLAPQPTFDTLEYTFLIERQDVKERCVVLRDGLAVFEVTHDGQGKLNERLGDRLIVLADGRTANAGRKDRWAMLHEIDQRERFEPLRPEQLRRYALIGCQFDLPLFEMARVLDDAEIEIAEGEWEGTACHVATITLPPRASYLGCGVMLGFTSWSYVHHIRPAYEVIYIDKERLVPLHETFVSTHDNRRFEIDYGDLVTIQREDSVSMVPLDIEIESKDYFTCHYEFQLIDGQQWLLQSVESWFKPDKKCRGVVADVVIDQPSPLVADVEQQVQAYREVFEVADDLQDSQTQAVTTMPFRLGERLTLGPAEIVFTLDAKDILVLRCTASEGGDLVAGGQVIALLLDEENNLLQASQDSFKTEEIDQLVATLSFGQSQALGETTRFVVAGLGDVSGIAGAESRPLRVWHPGDEKESLLDIGIADKRDNTRLIDVALDQRGEEQATATLTFASRDRMNEFQFDTPVAVFSKLGKLVAAATKTGSVRVESKIAEETWEVVLPPNVVLDEVGALAIGLSRGQTVSMPMGSVWGMFLDRAVPFSTETMLATSEPSCWKVALKQIENEIDEAVRDGLLESRRNWQMQKEDQRTPADLLRPHVDRLLEIVHEADDPAILSMALRLLGFAGDEHARGPAEELLSHEDLRVQDAAAIALGLLGSDEGLVRLDAILARPKPKVDDPGRFHEYQTRSDALVALVSLRSSASIELVEKWMRTYVEGIGHAKTESDSQRSEFLNQGAQLALLLSQLKDPRYVDILTAAVEQLEGHSDLDRGANVGEWLSSILNYGEAAREFIEPRIERGDVTALYALEHQQPHDAYYVEAVRKMIDAEVNPNAWRWAAWYLWNIGSPEALSVLQEAYEHDVPAGAEGERARLSIATALAALGDSRGFPDALGVLEELAPAPSRPPTDREARKQWKRQIEDRREDALGVFDRAGNTLVSDFLTNQAADASPAKRQALLQIVEKTDTLPKGMRSQVEAWAADSSNEQVAEGAQRLLVRF